MADLKRQDFLWGMATAYFFPFENYDTDYEALKLADQIRSETDRKEDPAVISYADVLKYVRQLEFRWEEGVPDEYRALEQWWNMVNSGVTPGGCYLFYVHEIANFVTEDLLRAKRRAHTIWKPLSRRPPSELTQEQQNDPNSASANLPNAAKSASG